MCRAHGIAHQRITTPGDLAPALTAARGLNKHSVVEVITSRDGNMQQHKAIQAAVRRAVVGALATRVGESARVSYNPDTLWLSHQMQLLMHSANRTISLWQRKRDKMFPSEKRDACHP